ncbi:hypothetical protein V6N13_114098 [Hibiscus sabdariffa]
MKRLSSSKIERAVHNVVKGEIEWDLRSGGMLVQKREMGDASSGPMVIIKVSHGFNDMSKVVLLDDSTSKERKLEEMKRKQSVVKSCEEVAKVRAEIDKLSEKVNSLDAIVGGGTRVAVEELLGLTELLMAQLLQLDTIEAVGEDKVQRRAEVMENHFILNFGAQVHRVQGLVDTMDEMKARNCNPSSSNGDAGI